MKNPHGVEPTRFWNRENSEFDFQYNIECDPSCGPLFGFTLDYYDGCYSYYFDIFINDDCNEKNSCYIDNEDSLLYECHPEYKASLFVNTAGPHSKNYFTVLDYEVYTH